MGPRMDHQSIGDCEEQWFAATCSEGLTPQGKRGVDAAIRTEVGPLTNARGVCECITKHQKADRHFEISRRRASKDMAIPEHVKAGANVLVKEFTRHNTQTAPALARNPAHPTPETHRVTRRPPSPAEALKKPRRALPNTSPTSPRPPDPKPTASEPPRPPARCREDWEAIRPPCGRDARPCMSWAPVGFHRPPPRSCASATSAGKSLDRASWGTCMHADGNLPGSNTCTVVIPMLR